MSYGNTEDVWDIEYADLIHKVTVSMFVSIVN